MSKNSFSAEQIGYFGKPTYTKESIRAEKIRHERMDALGIERGGFSSEKGNEYTDDEKEAIRLIYENKEVPKELADRIKEYHSKNDSKQKHKYKMKIASPEQISKILGIKEKDQW